MASERSRVESECQAGGRTGASATVETERQTPRARVPAKLVVQVAVGVVCLAVGLAIAGGWTAVSVGADSDGAQEQRVDAGAIDGTGTETDTIDDTEVNAGVIGTGDASEDAGVFTGGKLFEDGERRFQMSRADLQLHSVEVPNVVEAGGTLAVGYTVENIASKELTDEVLLRVGQRVENSTNVSARPGERVTGTVVFDGVGERFEPGDTMDVGLDVASFGSSASRDIEVRAPGPAPELHPVEAPDVTDPDGAFEVEYAVENVGTAGTVEDVELVADNSVVDIDEKIAIGAGETVDGTLSASADTEGFDDGNTVRLTVELAGPAGVAAADADSVSTGVAEVPNQSVEFEGQNLTTPDTVMVDSVRSNGSESAVVVTYADDNESVVAGLTTGTFDGEAVAVTLADRGGLVGNHTVHILPVDALSGEYTPGDNVSAVTAESVVARTSATVGLDVNGNGNSATDTTCNGLVNDVTGTGTFGIGDVATLFDRYGTDIVTENAHLFDFSGSGDIGIADVVALFNKT